MIANRDGKLWGHYQGGEGLLSAIQEKMDTTNKKIVIVGASSVAKTLTLALNNCDKKPKEIIIANRTFENAEQLKTISNLVAGILGLSELGRTDGDIIVNASRIGSEAEDDYFNSDLVNKFACVADVTFGVENTNLVNLAKKNNKIVVTGWDMFTHQAAVVIKEVIGHHADIDSLRSFVKMGLSKNNHGAVLKGK